MWIGCDRGEDAAFDDVVVADERGLDVAGCGIPDPCGLVVTAGDQEPTIETCGYVTDPVDVVAECLHAVAGCDIPYPQRLVP